MAFNPDNLGSGSGNFDSLPRNGDSPEIWTYFSAIDDVNAMAAPGYFVNPNFAVGDLIYVSSLTSSTPQSGEYVVSAVDSTGVATIQQFYAKVFDFYAFYQFTTVGGAPTELFTIADIPYFHFPIGSLQNSGPNAVSLVTVANFSDTQVALTFSADPGAGAIVNVAMYINQ